MTTLTYSIAADTANGTLDERSLHVEMKADATATEIFSGVGRFGDVLNVEVSAVPTTPQQTAIDAVVAAHVGVDKHTKLKAIDDKTDAMIESGFEFPPASGNMHSLSLAAQARIIAADAQRDDPAFTYPIEWNWIDDDGTTVIADSATLHGFVLTAIGTARAYLDSGTTLKKLVHVATTQAQVDAVVDNR